MIGRRSAVPRRAMIVRTASAAAAILAMTLQLALAGGPTMAQSTAPAATPVPSIAVSGDAWLLLTPPDMITSNGTTDEGYAVSFSGTDGSASVAVVVTAADGAQQLRTDTFLWGDLPFVIRPEDPAPLTLTLINVANDGVLDADLHAYLTQPGTPCGTVSTGDTEIGAIASSAEDGAGSRTMGAFTVAFPSPGTTSPTEIQLNVCARVGLSTWGEAYRYHWGRAPSGSPAPDAP